MELNWSTFFLEIINFMVLLWILKRFLYKPVLEAVRRRQAEIEERVANAKELSDDAQKLVKQYESRLEEWEAERQNSRDVLKKELCKVRAEKMEELNSELNREKERQRIVSERYYAEELRKLEKKALKQGGAFAAHLLKQGAGPELEKRLVDLALEEIAHLSEEKRALIRRGYGKNRETVAVASAYPLAEEERGAVKRALEELVGETVALDFDCDSDLLAGLRITIGPFSMGLNVKDELEGFVTIGE